MSIIKEYLFTTDNFKQPATIYGRKAIGMLIARLLLLEPGTDPARPTMGVGLVSKYRYMFPDRLHELRQNIYSQLNTYLFPYSNVAIVLDVIDKELRVDITVDENTYKYVTKEQEDNVVTLQELQDYE